MSAVEETRHGVVLERVVPLLKLLQAVGVYGTHRLHDAFITITTTFSRLSDVIMKLAIRRQSGSPACGNCLWLSFTVTLAEYWNSLCNQRINLISSLLNFLPQLRQLNVNYTII